MSGAALPRPFGRVALAALLVFGGLAGRAAGHPVLVPDPGYVITSDFGPRTVAGGTPFHKAIDFKRALGTTVPLLEDGTVTSLNRASAGVVHLVSLVVTGVHTFRYLHFFDDTDLPIVSGSFVLATASGGSLAIVRMSGTPGRASYIISPNAGNTVTITTARPGLPMVPFTFRNAAGTANATTENALTTANHPDAGPAGGSGGFAVHMHVDHGVMAGGVQVSENPLYHITDRDSAYIVALQDKTGINRTAGYAVGPNDTGSTFLKLDVNSSVGKDLESARIYVDQADAAHLVREYVYGGQTALHDPINTDVGVAGVLSNGLTNGVQTFDAGHEAFVYNDWDSASTPAHQLPSDLPEGDHDFLFVLRDIHDNIPFPNNADIRFRFRVDRTAPVTVIPDVQKTP
jgi:hypothetical protein